MIFYKSVAMLMVGFMMAGCSDDMRNRISTKIDQVKSFAFGKKTDQSQELLAQLISLDAIGLNMAHVEKIAGPPIRSEDHSHQFNIGGCHLRLKSDESDKAVRSVQVAVTPACDVDVGGILGLEERLPLKSLTFGKFNDATTSGSYLADCLGDCGNAYVPNVYLLTSGSRAMQFKDVMIYIPLADAAALEARDHWLQAMAAKEPEKWIEEMEFNCSPERYRDAAVMAFGAINPSFIAFGHDLVYPKCLLSEPRDMTESIDVTSASPSGSIFVPQPVGKCDMDYEKRLKEIGLQAKNISIHGPDDQDFAGYACPYRITPAPGSPVPKGSTVTYRSAWEYQ